MLGNSLYARTTIHSLASDIHHLCQQSYLSTGWLKTLWKRRLKVTERLRNGRASDSLHQPVASPNLLGQTPTILPSLVRQAESSCGSSLKSFQTLLTKCGVNSGLTITSSSHLKIRPNPWPIAQRHIALVLTGNAQELSSVSGQPKSAPVGKCMGKHELSAHASQHACARAVKLRAGQHNNHLIHGIQPLQKVGKELGKIRREFWRFWILLSGKSPTESMI